MLLFGDLNNKSLTSSLSKELKTTPIFPEITVFPDGEREVSVAEVAKQDVVILRCLSRNQSIDSFLIETALVLKAISAKKAKNITLITPYFPYSRSDISTIKLFATLLKEGGFSRLIVVDPHNEDLKRAFGDGCFSIPTPTLFAEKIRSLKLTKVTLVSPDRGGSARVEEISGITSIPFVCLSKKRDSKTGNVSIEKLKDKVSKTCIIVDDMITTGTTIVKAVERLSEAGAEKFIVVATHGIFSGDAMVNLSSIENIFVTDSIEPSDKKIKVISIAKLIAQSLTHRSQ